MVGIGNHIQSIHIHFQASKYGVIIIQEFQDIILIREYLFGLGKGCFENLKYIYQYKI